MRKHYWIIVVALISCMVSFTSCEKVPKMLDPLLPDAEPMEEMMEPELTEMMEPPVGSVDVLIYTGSTWWITPANARVEAETTRSLLQAAGIEVAITESEENVRDWMLQTTADSAVNVLVVYGVIPGSIYSPANGQPDGSIAENWIETTDGDTILNQSDYLGWNSTNDPNKVGIPPEEWDQTNLPSVGSNRHGTLRNLMDIPNIVIDTTLLNVPMVVTEDGSTLTPSLVSVESDRPLPLNQLQGDWFAEKVFASDTGDAQATVADPVIVRDGDRGRLAIVLQTDSRDDPKGEVAAEVIINCLLADPVLPDTQVMETVETPAETEMPVEEMTVMIGVRKLYWGDIGTSTISSADPDGSNIQTLITGVRPWSLALDVDGGKIYWISLTGSIGRANLDGSNAVQLIPQSGEGIGLDLEAGKLYWAGSGRISRANLDGSGIETLVTGLSKPDSMALDLVNRKVYWTDSAVHTIQRANLDGSNVETLVTGLRHPQGLNLDVAGGKMYWSNWPPSDKIQRANLDGSNVEDIAPGRGGLEGIVLDFDRGKMYWTDFAIDKIQRADFDGSNIEDIVTTGLGQPISITLDIGPIN